MSGIHSVVSVLTIFSQRMPTCAKINSNYDIYVPKNFLKGVGNWDIQILRDVMSSEYFTFLSDSHSPAMVIFTKVYHEIENSLRIDDFVLNVFKSRPASSTISIWTSNLLFNTVEKYGPQKFPGWLELCTRYHYAFSCDEWWFDSYFEINLSAVDSLIRKRRKCTIN